MTPITFADTHNMVAYLSKSDASDGFDQMLDFLNAYTIKYALIVNPTIYVTCIKQFWTTTKVKMVKGKVQLQAPIDCKKVIVSDAILRRDLHLKDAEGIECLPNAKIFKELTRMGAKRTAWNEFSSSMASVVICLATGQKFKFLNHKTKYTSPALSQKVFANIRKVGKGFSRNKTPLFATIMVQPQPQANKGIEMPVAEEQPSTTRVHTPRSDEGRLEHLHELMEACTKLSQRVLDLETDKTAQALEIVKLNIRVKRGCIQTGGIIAEIDVDAEISLVDETKGRNDENDDNLMFVVETLDDGEVFVKTAKTVVDTAVVDETVAEVSADEPAVTTISTPVTTAGVTISAVEPIINIATDFSEVDMTLAKALAELNTSKPKVVTTAAVSTTATIVTTAVDHDAKVARTMQEQWRAQVDEEERLRKKRKDKAFMAAIAEVYDEKQLAAERAGAIRNKPPTKSQLRNLTMTYLKYTGRFTHAQIKSRGFKEIQKLYTKEKDCIDAFVPIGSKEDARRDGSRKKRATGSSTKQMSPKKQKENDQESVDSDKELRECLKVVPNDDKAIDYETLDVKSPIVDYESQFLTIMKVCDVHVYKLIRLNGSFRHFSTFSGMLEVLDRPDVLDLHKVVMERFIANDPEGYDLILWGDLKTLVEPNEDDEIWRNK
uniref:Xylulose kinase-1 n=1 Tax=Tanacetum cinerariifolium TaxID=118510 RepID=A0A699GVK1_TANCI|nr:hypothetical protein [Tanacetum cinerariifolium]